MQANSRCFIDSNIWLYAFIESDDLDKHKKAQRLIQTTTPIISTQVINEVCVNLIRKANFSEEQIRQLITSFYGNYQVQKLNQSTALAATQLRESYSLSFWDSMMIASALDASLSCLYSEDMHNGLHIFNQLQIINPF